MDKTIAVQASQFIIYTVCGVLIGVFFDIFRILRKSFKTADFITYIEDILFGILTGIFLIVMLFIVGNGELRLYIFLALILGLMVYLLTVSKYFIKASVAILVIIKKISEKVLFVLIYPVRKLLKLALKPFRFLIINIKNINFIRKVKHNNKKIFLKNKESVDNSPIKNNKQIKKKNVKNNKRILMHNVE